MTTTRTGIDLRLCARALGVDEDGDPDVLLAAARCRGWTLPMLLLSLYERDGHVLGSGARDELRRARRRRDAYGRVVAALAAETGARVLKGPSLAGHYPPGLLRPVGDLDVVVADEDELWRAVRAVRGAAPVADMHVSLYGHPDRHLLVQLTWPGDDPLLDRHHSVELSTAAFAGGVGPVRVRAELPEDPVVADLLALAEERFQRPYGLKDAVDTAVLGGLPACAAVAADLVAAAERWRVAPELLELLEFTTALVDPGCLGGLVEPLGAAAERERERRGAWTPPSAPAGADAMTRALVEGRPVGGLLLREPPAPRRSSVVRAYPGGALLASPVGDYLLVDQPLVTQDQYDEAVARLPLLDEG
ncbi:nucleotidyltransferase family protein [Saccharothrix algeriensis]|uniref:Nucleotidyltransferase family protein n=1 Tax=Saccharothrix algeriensis TaxID=173560 RepID=A0A8T8HWI2_9PSEU|nr:nucleotidyltransferase family protein [Saccharothrix algeriensis]MBM7814478.1 hypothetical protein [Saccharothrix algeriensis]QTR02777.1 nucleotidyltransferase family protein [Saccharothrix algeriensis]